jgi:DNA polymerase-3 subunit epsilon
MNDEATSNIQHPTSNIEAGRKYLFFDTETTGKADFRAPAEAPHQPRLVQLAAVLTEVSSLKSEVQSSAGTQAGGAVPLPAREIASLNVIVRPDGFEIPIEASAVHGITTAQALAGGIGLVPALALFSELARVADVFVCHNTQFDLLILDSELARTDGRLPDKPARCTMKLMTGVCRLPGPYGFKWPTLQEAYAHCFGREFDGAHDALADVRACQEIFFWLRLRQRSSEAAAAAVKYPAHQPNAEVME